MRFLQLLLLMLSMIVNTCSAPIVHSGDRSAFRPPRPPLPTSSVHSSSTTSFPTALPFSGDVSDRPLPYGNVPQSFNADAAAFTGSAVSTSAIAKPASAAAAPTLPRVLRGSSPSRGRARSTSPARSALYRGNDAVAAPRLSPETQKQLRDLNARRAAILLVMELHYKVLDLLSREVHARNLSRLGNLHGVVQTSFYQNAVHSAAVAAYNKYTRNPTLLYKGNLMHAGVIEAASDVFARLERSTVEELEQTKALYAKSLDDSKQRLSRIPPAAYQTLEGIMAQEEARQSVLMAAERFTAAARARSIAELLAAVTKTITLDDLSMLSAKYTHLSGRPIAHALPIVNDADRGQLISILARTYPILKSTVYRASHLQFDSNLLDCLHWLPNAALQDVANAAQFGHNGVVAVAGVLDDDLGSQRVAVELIQQISLEIIKITIRALMQSWEMQTLRDSAVAASSVAAGTAT